MTFTPMKFRAIDTAHDHAIQQALFDKGYKWAGSGEKTYWSCVDDEPNEALHTDELGVITYSDIDWFHSEHTANRPEYLLYRGELVEAGGSNPTFEEQQEVCVNATSRYRIYVGEAVPMPGTTGFTLAVFKASDVPVGTKLYA